MKKALSVLLFAALLCTVLAGCRPGEGASFPSSASAAGSSAAPPANVPESDAGIGQGQTLPIQPNDPPGLLVDPGQEPPPAELFQQTVPDAAPPDFLNEEQQDIFIRAARLNTALYTSPSDIDYRFPTLPGQELDTTPGVALDEGAWHYYPSSGRYQNWNDFLAIMYALFTPECFEAMNGDAPGRFMEQDSKLFILDADRGSHSARTQDPDGYRLVSSTDTAVDFMLIGYYDYESDGNITEEEIPIQMVLTDHGWRISQYGTTR